MLEKLPFTIESIHNAYRQGVTVSQVINESLKRLEKINDEGIYLHLPSSEWFTKMISDLGEFDLQEKPLWGIPFAVKDNIDVASFPTTASCEEFRYIAEEDAHVVSLLREAGAIVIGKTNLDQFATGLVGVRTPFSAPNNAIDNKLVPGGSSSGSAVAVAHAQVCFSLGTDTAGSGRIPAALNNIIGLKPSLGSISCHGVVPACRSLDTVSIFALNVDDARKVYASCRSFDSRDPYSKPYQGPEQFAIPNTYTLAVPNKKTLLIDESEQEKAYQLAIDYWQSQGATIIEIDFQPFYEVAKLLYEGPWVAERLAAVESFIKDFPDALHPVTDSIINSANNFSASDVFKAIYRLKILRQELKPLIESVDALCVPSMPGLVFKKDIEFDPIGPNSRLGTYTNFVNLMDLCAISVPGKVRNDGYPSSITLISQSGNDAFILTLAEKYHVSQASLLGATNHPLPNKPSITTSVISEMLGSDEIAIAVVGAHMTGLPLNHQLTDLKGRFLTSTQTQPTYKFYKLGDEKPLRPGLVRDSAGQAIKLEVWALPKKEFGKFIEKIPSPLSIGTISLADQQQVKGFLCESFALKDAQDITEFGGWRSFLETEELL